MATVESTGSLIEAHLDMAKAAQDINTLHKNLACIDYLRFYMNDTQSRIYHALCERFRDWAANIQTSK